MKKLLALIAALVIGGAAFAQNKTKGLDFHAGIPHNRNMFFSSADTPQGEQKNTLSWYELGFQLKLASYNGLWLNDHIGIYASVGIGITPTLFSYNEVAVGGDKTKNDIFETSPLAVYGEVMVGPSFGVDIGKIRFQGGVAIHALVGSSEGHADKNGVRIEEELKMASLGFALTPQFRFFADKRVSLVVGTDLIFDFPLFADYTVERKPKGQRREKHRERIEFDTTLRFAFTPYIGLGLNF